MAAKNSQRWTKNIHAQLRQECEDRPTGKSCVLLPCGNRRGRGGRLEEPPVTLGELCHQRLRTPSLSCLCVVACGSQMPSKECDEGLRK